MSSHHALQLAEIARDLDMVVFRLERPIADERHTIVAERERLRRELEQLCDQLNDLARAMEG
jgi:hypothetical protein